MAFVLSGKHLRPLFTAAGLVVLASGTALAGPFGLFPGSNARPAPSAPVVQAQIAGDTVYQIGQLEEQIRQLNGRIEELSFQIIQMQEQMRQQQEDNEFRFQQLEGGAAPASDRSAVDEPAAPASSDMASAAPAAQPSGDVTGATGSVAGQTGGPGTGAVTAPAEQTLGTMIFDEQGNLQSTIEDGPVGANGAGAATASLSVDDPDMLYRDAYNFVLSGDYAEAERAFRDYIDIYPDGGRVADAHFWLGESQFSQGSFNDAARTFLEAHKSYPQAEKAPEMLLKLGMSLARLENRDTACATYREVLSRYPDASQAVRDKVAAELRNANC